MAKCEVAIVSKDGETLMSPIFWRPHQGNTVVLSGPVPATAAVYPDGVTLNLNDAAWQPLRRERLVLDGDALDVDHPADKLALLLYTTVDNKPMMVLCTDLQVLRTVRVGDRNAMLQVCRQQGIVATLAWAFLYETWKDLRIKSDPPMFLPPGEPLRDAALGAARVLYDSLLDSVDAGSYLDGKYYTPPAVLRSWVVPFNTLQAIRSRLCAARWVVRCALNGGKRSGRLHGRLPKRVEVPNWRSFQKSSWFLEEVYSYWQAHGSSVGIPKKAMNP